MTKSKHPKYWNNDKSRALRSLTMRLSRMNRIRLDISEETYRFKKKAIDNAREEIYEIPRPMFTMDDRERIFMKYDLMEEKDG